MALGKCKNVKNQSFHIVLKADWTQSYEILKVSKLYRLKYIYNIEEWFFFSWDW